jgi:hypothetical protein
VPSLGLIAARLDRGEDILAPLPTEGPVLLLLTAFTYFPILHIGFVLVGKIGDTIYKEERQTKKRKKQLESLSKASPRSGRRKKSARRSSF